MKTLEISYLFECFTPYFEGGLLVWNHRPETHFKNLHGFKVWNARFSGERAFTALDGGGYHYGAINRSFFKLHRVLWAMHSGEWVHKLDHKNGVKTDNAILNLRHTTPSKNARNAKRSKANTTGATGVYLRPNGRFQATLRTDAGMVTLGTFSSLGLAKDARRKAQTTHGYSERYGEA